MKNRYLFLVLLLVSTSLFLINGCGTNATGGGSGGGGTSLTMLFMAPDSSSASHRNEIMVYSVNSSATESAIALPVSGAIRAIALSPDKTKLFANYTNVKDMIYTIDPSTKAITSVCTVEKTGTVTFDTLANCMALSPDGKKIYVPSASSTNYYVGVFVFNVTGDAVTLGKYVTKETISNPISCAIAVSKGSSNGRYVYFSEYSDHLMYQYDTISDTMITREYDDASSNIGMTFNNAGDKLYCGGNDNIYVMDTSNHSNPYFTSTTIEVGSNKGPSRIQFTSGGIGYVANNNYGSDHIGTYAVISASALTKIGTTENSEGKLFDVVIDEGNNKVYFDGQKGPFGFPPYSSYLYIVGIGGSVEAKVLLPDMPGNMVGK